jgi:uncharacterized protein YlxW (UPF0749 family)
MSDIELADLERMRSKDIKILGAFFSVFLLWAGWFSTEVIATSGVADRNKAEHDRREAHHTQAVPQIQRDVEVLKSEQRHQTEKIDKLDRKVENLDTYLRNKLGE